jgi:hypothetical protein
MNGSIRNIKIRNQIPILVPESEQTIAKIEIIETELHKERWAQCLNDGLNWWGIMTINGSSC